MGLRSTIGKRLSGNESWHAEPAADDGQTIRFGNLSAWRDVLRLCLTTLSDLVKNTQRRKSNHFYLSPVYELPHRLSFKGARKQ